MKTMYHFPLILMLCCLMFSCSNLSSEGKHRKDNKPLHAGIANKKKVSLFNGQYVEGVILAKAVNDDFGLVTMHKEDSHDYSYMALYRGEDLEDEFRLEKVIFKVDEINGVPIAHSIEPLSATNKHLADYPHDPITRMSLHSLSSDDHSEFIHINKHLTVGGSGGGAASYSSFSPNSGSTGPDDVFKVEVGMVEGSYITLYSSNYWKNKAAEYGSGEFFIEYDTNTGVITDLDICHRHFGIPVDCRD